MQNVIYIIIVTYNGMQWLPKTLAEIPKKYNVVIVDNNSTDDTVTYVKQNYTWITLFSQTKNLGFGGGNNLGIAFALKNNADNVFLLNQDVCIDNKTIDILIENQIKNPSYGILSPVHLNASGDKLDRKFSHYMSYDNNSNFYSDAVLNKKEKNIYKVDFINAAAWLVTKKCLEQIGGFDPIFFHYGEDNNYCQRLKYHNFKIGVVSNAFVNHDRIQKKPFQIIPFTKKYFTNREKILKNEYANINVNNIESRLKKEKRRLNKQIIKSILSLRLNLVKGLLKERDLLRKISPQIRSSYHKNKIKNANYLKF